MSNKKPKVSILIPVFNRDSLITETLNSAINQTYSNTEIIVVDNKSEDKTFDILKKFSKKYLNIKVYQNKKNIGPVKNWRKCIDYATGEYTKILWSDDLIDKTFIEKTLPYLIGNKDVGFVFTGTENFSEKERKKAYFIGETGVYDSRIFIEGSLLGGPFPVSPGNAIFRLKDLKKNLIIDIPNKFGIDFKMYGMGNDVLIFLLTAKDYPKFAFINEILSFFRYHADSISIYEDRFKSALRYRVAKAYFIENYVMGERIKRKFNSILLGVYFKEIFMKKKGLNFLKSFYINENNVYFDIIFFAKKLISKVFSLIAKIFD